MRCGRKRDDAREAYLSATSSAGPAGEMKLDHLYWVVRRGGEDLSLMTEIGIHRLVRRVWQQED